MPDPIEKTKKPNPMDMPNICGTVRQKPKFTPDAKSIKLFGPGVTEVATANVASAMRVSSVIIASNLQCPQ